MNLLQSELRVLLLRLESSNPLDSYLPVRRLSINSTTTLSALAFPRGAQ